MGAGLFELFARVDMVALVRVMICECLLRPFRQCGEGVRVGAAGGKVEGEFPADDQLLQAARSGSLRALASTGLTRTAAAADLPTVSESGLNGFESSVWFGLMAPQATPQDIVLKLNAAAARAISAPDAAKQLLQIGADPAVRTPGAFGEFVREDNARYGKLVREAGIKLE